MTLIQLICSGVKSVRSKLRPYPLYYSLAKLWRSVRGISSITSVYRSEDKRILKEAFNSLMLTNDLREQILRLASISRVSDPEKILQLVEFSCEPEWNQQYDNLVVRSPEILKEELAWLSLAIRRAIKETSGDAVWSMLFMTIAYKAMICRKVEQRLNPLAMVNTPSAFVYAMH